MFQVVTARAAAVALLWMSACGPLTPPARELGTVAEALSMSPEIIDLVPLPERADLYSQALVRSREEAAAELFDGPALFAVEWEGHLVAGALPEAAELIAGTGCAVDLDASSDPWPREPRAGLNGLSERTLAEEAGSRLARVVGATPPIPVERAVGAPYAAAFVQGTLRLNPVVLYLASGVGLAATPTPAPNAATRPPKAHAVENMPGAPEHLGPSCAVAPGTFAPWLLPALLGLRVRRKARTGRRNFEVRT